MKTGILVAKFISFSCTSRRSERYSFSSAVTSDRHDLVVPSAEVILVQHNQVPIDAVYPLVLRLDVAIAVSAEVVLERTKHH